MNYSEFVEVLVKNDIVDPYPKKDIGEEHVTLTDGWGNYWTDGKNLISEGVKIPKEDFVAADVVEESGIDYVELYITQIEPFTRLYLVSKPSGKKIYQIKT